MDSWVSAVSTHHSPVPYATLQPRPSLVPKLAVIQGWPWDVQLCLRSWCRLRAGLISLGARAGRRSSARCLQCIFCDEWVVNILEHVISSCPCWEVARASLVAEGFWPPRSRLVASSSSSSQEVLAEVPPVVWALCAFEQPCPLFFAIVRFIGSVDTAAQMWWRSSRNGQLRHEQGSDE